MEDNYQTMNLLIRHRDWERIRDYVLDGQQTGTDRVEKLQQEAVTAMLRWIEEHPLDETSAVKRSQ